MLASRGVFKCLRFMGLRRSVSRSSSFDLDTDDDDDDEEESAEFNRIQHEIELCELHADRGLLDLLKYREDLETDIVALVWAVVSFCREAILRETRVFVHKKYTDMYDKYVQVVGREENLIVELGMEKTTNRNLQDEIDKLRVEIQNLKCAQDKTSRREENLNSTIKYLKQGNKVLKKKLLKSHRLRESDKLRIAQLEKSLDAYNSQYIKFQRNREKRDTNCKTVKIPATLDQGIRGK